MARKVKSATTPNHKMQLRSWLAELVMLRSNRGRPLPPYFWRDNRWKWAYTREVKAVSKFIKSYGENIVVSVACNKKIHTFTDYANLEFHLQNEQASVERLARPKDLGEVMNEDAGVVEDLREPRSFAIKKTLFERLAELEDE